MVESPEKRAARLLEIEARQFSAHRVEMVGFSDIEGVLTLVYDRFGDGVVAGVGPFRERRASTYRPNDTPMYGGTVETQYDRDHA